jgi:hypothetical protein
VRAANVEAALVRPADLTTDVIAGGRSVERGCFRWRGRDRRASSRRSNSSTVAIATTSSTRCSVRTVDRSGSPEIFRCGDVRDGGISDEKWCRVGRRFFVRFIRALRDDLFQ